jgi:hypothetical protein
VGHGRDAVQVFPLSRSSVVIAFHHVRRHRDHHLNLIAAVDLWLMMMMMMMMMVMVMVINIPQGCAVMKRAPRQSRVSNHNTVIRAALESSTQCPGKNYCT